MPHVSLAAKGPLRLRQERQNACRVAAARTRRMLHLRYVSTVLWVTARRLLAKRHVMFANRVREVRSVVALGWTTACRVQKPRLGIPAHKRGAMTAQDMQGRPTAL